MKETLTKKLVELLKVKSLITLSVMAVFCILALKSKIPTELTASVITAVVTYYFTKKEEKTETEETIEGE